MSRFIGEAEDFGPPREPCRLIITEDLLDELRVTDCPRAEQQGAVDHWLAFNRPNQILALSLREDRFLEENVSNGLSNERPRTGPDDAGPASRETRSDLHERGRRRTRPDRAGRGAAGS
jgi:hypothetical protein